MPRGKHHKFLLCPGTTAYAWSLTVSMVLALQKESLHQRLEEVLAENAVWKDQVRYTDLVFC